MTDHPVADADPLPRRTGERLRAAREAKGMSLAAVGEMTRIPLRHLEAMEVSNYDGLPSPTYAVGFARAYARAVGVDEVGIAQAVRGEAAATGRPRPEYQPYVTADPARLPSRGLAIGAAGLALAVLILAALWFGARSMRSDEAPAPATAAVATTPVPARTAAAVGGQVTLIATDAVWMRVYDSADKTLFLGTMKPGDRFDVPPGANRPMINVGRPDQLQVTLNGSAVPALGDGKRAIKDVPVDGSSIAARAKGSPAAPASPTPTPSPSPSASASPSPRPSPSPSRARPSDNNTTRGDRRPERAADPAPTPRAPSTPAPTPSASAAPPVVPLPTTMP